MEFSNMTGQLIEDAVTPLEFRIPKSDYLIDLSQLFLKFKVKITTTNDETEEEAKPEGGSKTKRSPKTKAKGSEET